MTTAKPIPISAGEKIAKSYGYDQVVIIARKVGDDGTEHVTTYGVDKTHCDVAARTGDFLKHKIMGWPQDFGSKALNEIHAERRRQIEVEGWTPDHDDQHGQGVMSGAGACYALEASKFKGGIFAEAAADIIDKAISDLWPWNATWWKPKDRRSDLVRAGALIIAEIERLDRAAAKGGAA